MNKLVLSCLLTMVISKSTAQVNEYFKGNPQWGIFSERPNGDCIYGDNYNYYINGDTLINGFVYKQIYKKGVYYSFSHGGPPISNCPADSWYVNTSPDLLLRSFNKKMYVRLNLQYDTLEYLLYDFDLSLGDTLPYTYNNSHGNLVVASIDSFYTPYGYRKKFNLANTFPDYALIEGIGFSEGLLERVQWESRIGLNCYSLNDTNYYPTMGGNCISPARINTKIANKTSVTISPNPFTSTANVEFTKLHSNATLYIYNTLGQLVQQQTIVPTSTLQLERNTLPAGLYYYTLAQPNNTNVVGKFVITD
jgi:Secretion system C-terminal sorting domain